MARQKCLVAVVYSFRQPHHKDYKKKDIMKLYKFQEEAIADLLSGKHIVISSTGSGKGAMAVIWASEMCKRKNKQRVLVVTTASKSRTGDFESDADAWCGEKFRENLKEFTVISWHKLRAWNDAHRKTVVNYVIIFDEIAKAAAGVSSGMGRAFLQITRETANWAGFTATPGDTWLKFYPYFQACGFVKNKTAFLNDYVNMQSYRGFPEIVGYRNEGELKRFWKKISTAPDTSKMMAELPPEMHKVVEFKKASTYDRTMKTLTAPDGTILDTCFPADTPVATEHGIKKLCDIQIGENVWSYNIEKDKLELMPVVDTIKHKIAGRIIVLTLSNGESIISTDDHRHFVNGSYIRADRIKEGDYLYVANSLRNMWQKCRNTKNSREQDKKIQKKWKGFLFEKMYKHICIPDKQEERRYPSISEGWGNNEMRKLWKNDTDNFTKQSPARAVEERRESVLLPQLRDGGEEKKSKKKRSRSEGKKIWKNLRMFDLQDSNRCDENRRWQTSELREDGQNILQQQVCERICSRGSEESVTRAEQTLQLYETENRLRERILNLFGTKNKRLSDTLQSRYSNSNAEDSDRMRWKRPQKPNSNYEGQKKGKEIKGVRVEGVEVLELGDIKRHGLYRDPDNVYCIEVDGNHNFFANGILTHNCGSLCAELRRQCFTKDKQQWVKDFVENLGDGAVMFYNFIATGDLLEGLLLKALPKGARVWRIDGKHHEIPTASTIGKRDIVLCQWQSGSEALNLQFLHYWVSVELCYSYSTAIQARGRIKRIGQQMPMHYYYLQTKGTIETAIMRCLKNKGEFAEDVWLADLKEKGEL